LFSKIEVNGEGTDPLYQHLKAEAGGLLTDGIKWNFTKFLIGRDGRVLDRFAPFTKPSDIEEDIVEALKR
jgi:glutathione peroxidase